MINVGTRFFLIISRFNSLKSQYPRMKITILNSSKPWIVLQIFILKIIKKLVLKIIILLLLKNKK